MDKAVIDAYHDYEDALERFSRHGDVKKLYEDEVEFRKVTAFLNVQELIAVGIKSQLLDDRLCYDFWSDELIDAYQHGKALIEYMREKDGSPFSYKDLEAIYHDWKRRDDKDRKRLPAAKKPG